MKSRKRVLFIDDEENILSAIRRAFRLADFDFDTVQTAESALSLVKTKNFDLVLSDFRMQGMTGLDLIAQIHLLYPELPCGILSGFADEKLIHDALVSRQIVTYLLKPIDNDRLLKEIYRLLGISTKNVA